MYRGGGLVAIIQVNIAGNMLRLITLPEANIRPDIGGRTVNINPATHCFIILSTIWSNSLQEMNSVFDLQSNWDLDLKNVLFKCLVKISCNTTAQIE